MTRIGVIADVHADVHALRDALGHMDRLGCRMILCAGDVVGYGVFPEETVALLHERVTACVRGNHDRWALGDGTPEDWNAGSAGGEHDASGWDLSREARRFLRALARSWHGVIDGVRVAMVHGTPRSEMDGIFLETVTGGQLRRWLDECDADVLIVGHTHEPFRLVAPGGGAVVNPGVLRRTPPGEDDRQVKVFDTKKDRFVPVPRPPTGTFGVLELPSKKFTVRLAADGSQVEVARVAKY